MFLLRKKNSPPQPLSFLTLQRGNAACDAPASRNTLHINLTFLLS
ncbi:MAG: DUF1534 domain-containing protein [Methyloprofundus sp.]|nr:DUF1534 domain-containing protein [Methyloprofundus sp.]